MDKATFVKLIESNCNFFDQVLKFQEMNIEIWDSNLVKSFNDVFSISMRSMFNQNGLEWIEWYCYEKRHNPSLVARDKDGNEICRTPEELYDFLTTCTDDNVQRDKLN